MPEQVYIALALKEGRQVYTLVHCGKALKSFETVGEAVQARSKLEKRLLEEERV